MFIIPENFETFHIKGLFSQKLPKTLIKELFPLVFFPKQVHSDHILLLEKPFSSFSLPGDSVITFSKELAIGIQTADCVPILIADKKKRVIGAVHAGWRGTLKEILRKTLEKIISFGIKSDEFLIAIGPHIKRDCYEVGEEVIEKLPENFRRKPFIMKNGKAYYLNLEALNVFQAKALGIPEKNIWVSKDCTHCHPEKYHSYRREKNYLYTQVALISLK